MEPKSEIRRSKRALRKALPSDVRQRYSEQIALRVTLHPLFARCEFLFCYMACKEEVDLTLLMKAAWKSGKRVAVPRVLSEGEMEFFEIHGFDELSPGYAGILEPMPNKIPVEVRDGQNVLVLLPGLAFDREGNRLGYGKGFYDRYLERHPSYHTMGIAFSTQCEEKLPATPHDEKVDLIMTEKGVRW